MLKMTQFGAILFQEESRIYDNRNFHNNFSRNFSIIKILNTSDSYELLL